MNASQVFTVDVRVNLRRGNVGMAEHFLYRPQICPAFQQMSRKRVAKRVRRDPLRDPGLVDVFAKNLPQKSAFGVPKTPVICTSARSASAAVNVVRATCRWTSRSRLNVTSL